MLRLMTLVKTDRESSKAFAERLSGKIQSLGGPDRRYVFRCRDVSEQDLHPIVEYLWSTGSHPHFQFLRLEHQGVTTSCEFWLGWNEEIVTRTMEHVLGDQGEIERDRTQFH
jgi:hypothetical protein